MPRFLSTRRRMRAAAAAGLLGLLAATPAHAYANGAATGHPGGLDPSFGQGGLTVTGFPGRAVGASAIAQHGPDGGLIVAGGAITPGTPDFLLARYRADGTLDPRFGAGGRVVTSVPAGLGAQGATGVAVDSRWRIVAVGTGGIPRGTQIGFAVARYLPDGALDTGFGRGGVKVLPVGPAGDAGAAAVVVQPDGGIVVAGGANDIRGDVDFAAVRLRGDGTLDPAFGNGGIVLVPLPGGDAAASAVALQPDGKILLAGTSVDPAAGQEFAVVRLTAGGVPDGGFGRGGIVRVQNSPGQSKGGASAVAVDPVGRVVVAGVGQTVAGQAGFALVRLRPDGALDPAFGTGGKVLTTFTGDSGASSLLLRRDGGMVAAGSAGYPSKVALAGYRADGSLDPAFGAGGKTTTAAGVNASATGAVFPGGTRIVVAGTTFNQDASAGSFLVAGYEGFPIGHHGYGPPNRACRPQCTAP
ncbi:hypothetical protein [Hamadaea tsunoensis]|uniref:hypothetical protein n=1 Tax=Hamadaea tsunoensis TaxID=53368 RepID=UPI000422B2A4|nr:hypothetical protein [Hamadaea tsunoensis]